MNSELSSAALETEVEDSHDFQSVQSGTTMRMKPNEVTNSAIGEESLNLYYPNTINIVDTTGSSLRKMERQTSDVSGSTLRKGETETSLPMQQNEVTNSNIGEESLNLF
jgi:hypothetical protein